MVAVANNPKTYRVRLPPDQARKLDALAERQGRDESDIVAEAVQTLWAERVERLFAETRAYAAIRNPDGYTEEDVPRLIREVRDAAHGEELKGTEAASSAAHMRPELRGVQDLRREGRLVVGELGKPHDSLRCAAAIIGHPAGGTAKPAS